MKKQQPSASPTSASPSSAPTYAGECPSGYVQCENGYSVVDGESMKCEEACGNEYDPKSDYGTLPYKKGSWSGGQCCSGIMFYDSGPCDRFTGSVCKDGKSCVGRRACVVAKVSSVVRSCYGTASCNFAGNKGGSVGKVIDSCQGDYSCYKAASTRENSAFDPNYRTGSIEEIVGSCKGKKSCQNAAFSGSIKSIIGSCFGEASCRFIAQKGSIEDIYKSCNGTRACETSTSIGGSDIGGTSIGGVGILNSCNANEACRDLAKTNTTIVLNCTGPQFPPYCDNVYNCTEGAQQVFPDCPSCRDLWLPDDFDSYNECLGNAFQQGTFPKNCTGLQEVPFCPDTVPKKDNCTDQLVYPRCPPNPFIYYSIANGLDSCCNHPMECKGDKTQDDLPDDCSVPADLPSKVKKNKKNKKNKNKKKPWD